MSATGRFLRHSAAVFRVTARPEFNSWLDPLAEPSIPGVVVSRIKRLERGPLGDAEPVGEGVSELRIHVGAGWRVYFTQRGGQLVVLLAGGSKRTRKERHQAREGAGHPAGPREKTKMRKRIKVDELLAFDAAPYLDSDEAIASYLTDILQANDAGLLSAALGDIARALGMTDIAKAAGITREALYKALRPGSAPRFDTVNRVCTALGVRLVVQPLHPV